MKKKTAREFLMLAHDFDVKKHHVAGAFVSEKMDGMRAIWIPSTVGVEVRQVPFANLQKDAMNNAGRPASGLWSRYGNPIWAPLEWTKELPFDLVLDGELWNNGLKLQEITSIVKKKEGVLEEWNQLSFNYFDSPPLKALFTPGKIHNMQWKHFVFPEEVPDWMRDGIIEQSIDNQDFEYMTRKLANMVFENKVTRRVPQLRLSFGTDSAQQQLDKFLEVVLARQGEGCIVRQPHSHWEPYRSNMLIKVKPAHDTEGTVVGWEPGKGRLEGMMGSLTINWKNPLGKPVQFQLSGFTDDQRRLVGGTSQYPEGTIVTFKYRELTDDGLPKEARFFRLRTD